MTNAVERPAPKPVPLQARAQARERAILEAANSFIVAGQIDAVTTTSVAKQAGIPVGSVYRYFEDRTHILDHLYRTAYAEIESHLTAVQASKPKGQDLADTIRFLLHTFWIQAQAHPSFRVLTRWANQHYSLWDVTPGPGSNLAALIKGTLRDAGIAIPEARQHAATKTMVTAASILVDLSLEEHDEAMATALIDELAILLEVYTRTFMADTKKPPAKAQP